MKTVVPKEKTLKVEAGLDWQVGEKIAIAPTNMRTMDLDICVIESYINGEIICEEELQGFHFGDTSSTGPDYGVDMRAEIVLLERNIEIRASQDDIGKILDEPWGCRILVADYLDIPSGKKMRTGSVNLDHVSVYNCSQKDTYHAAV